MRWAFPLHQTYLAISSGESPSLTVNVGLGRLSGSEAETVGAGGMPAGFARCSPTSHRPSRYSSR